MVRTDKPAGTYIILFIPWMLAWVLQGSPILSYSIAWLGSFFIFYMIFSGKLKALPTDRNVDEQLMRPIFLLHIIFAGFMCTTSIFYFFDTLGYENFKKVNDSYLVDPERLLLAAQCQRYYCLGHAAMVTGMLTFMKYPVKRKYYIENQKLSNLLLLFALATLIISTFFLTIPVLWQLYFKYGSLSFIAGTLALAFAIPLGKTGNTMLCILLFIFNLYEALISGFKEPIIISLLVLAIFLYPNYKRAVTIIFGPVLISLFILLPTYNRVFREQVWGGNINENDASKAAITAMLNNKESNWDFFAFRLSEISMFSTFVKSTPAQIDFYGTKLLEQSVSVLVPRIFWPNKPSTEELVMQRVYNAGVINRGSNVSAKPAFIVDAYLSGGAPGIFILLFMYGAIAQLISLNAEKLFGGYVLGSALIFSGLFQIFWRGLSFEFLINSVFWSYIIMVVIARVFVVTKILKAV